MRHRTAVAVGGVLSCAATAGLVLAGGEGEAAPAPAPAVDCRFLRVHSVGARGMSVVSLVSLSDGTMDRVRTLDRRVNAIGHHRSQGLVYGLASGEAHGGSRDRAHVVALGRDGSLTDLGPVRRVDGVSFPSGGLTGATAGAVVGDLLHVRDGHVLHAVDIDPDSPTFLGVVRGVRLWPAALAHEVDDFDVRPADGLLYGVTTLPAHFGWVVRIDPRTGRVERVPGPRLPGSRSYGSAVLGPDDALYAASNRTAGHHRPGSHRGKLVRVGLHPDATVTEIATWPAVDAADAAGCLAAPPDPPPVTTTTAPPTSPPTSTTLPPVPTTTAPPATTTTTTGPPIPSTTTTAPFVPPPPPVAPTSREPSPVPQFPAPPPAPPQGPPPVAPRPVAPPPGTVPPTSSAQPVPPPAFPPYRPSDRSSTPASPGTSTEEKRRWGLAVLLVVLGAGAAAARSRHR